MRLSPLQLANYRLLDIKVTARSGIDPSLENFDALLDEIHASLDLAREEERDTEDSSCWSVFLALRFEAHPEEHSPYDFHVVLLAEFFCAKQPPENLDQETLVGVNGTSITYGIARELILNLTEKGLWGGLTLPTMTFINFRELLESENDEELAEK